MTRISKTMKKARIKRGLTQEQVAHTLGLERSTYVSHIENAKCPPSPRVMRGMCEIYNIDFTKTLNMHIKDYKDNFIIKSTIR